MSLTGLKNNDMELVKSINQEKYIWFQMNDLSFLTVTHEVYTRFFFLFFFFNLMKDPSWKKV